MGLSEIKKKLFLASEKKKRKIELMLNDLEDLLKSLEETSEKVSRFEKKWGTSSELRELIEKGLITEVEVVKRLTKPSLLDKLTGKYYETLALKILNIPQEINKSVLSLSEIAIYLRDKIGNVNLNEVQKALKLLKKRGLILDVFKKDGITYAEFREIYDDFKAVLDFIREERKKTITVDEVATKLKWDIIRAEKVLEKMVEMGILVKEDYPPRYHLVSYD